MITELPAASFQLLATTHDFEISDRWKLSCYQLSSCAKRIKFYLSIVMAMKL